MDLIKTFLILFLLLLPASPVRAGDGKKPLQQTDFAYGMELTMTGNNAIYGLPVPAQVYAGCTSPTLADLRIFNSHAIVPHLVRVPRSLKKHPRPVSLPIFPLKGTWLGNTAHSDLHIATNSLGTIINVRLGGTVDDSASVSAYIIDTSVMKQRADWLELEWSGQSEHFSTAVRLESSTDLNNWQPMIRSAALAELKFADHSLLRSQIPVPRGIAPKTYLRLSWPAGREGVLLKTIKAGYNREDAARTRTVTTLTGQPAQDSRPNKISYDYTMPGFFPVDQIHVRPAQSNSLAQVTVYSRSNQETDWQQRSSLLAYQLTVNGVQLVSKLKNIKPISDRFWRLEMEKSDSEDSAPLLELGWLPGQLIFLAQGEGPFTLVYGRSGLAAAHFQVDQLLRSIDPLQEKNMVMPARAGAQFELGKRGVLEPAADLPWRRWLLWTVLIGGVLLVGAMALRLFKEMNRNKP
jgi:hypothetical protein